MMEGKSVGVRGSGCCLSDAVGTCYFDPGGNTRIRLSVQPKNGNDPTNGAMNYDILATSYCHL